MIPGKRNRIFLAGHTGLVGKRLLAVMNDAGYENIVCPERGEVDLRNSTNVEAFFKDVRPDVVVLAAAHVGSIVECENEPESFLYDNLMIQNNVFHSAATNGVRKLLFFASSNMYPEDSAQPMKETELGVGRLEKAREGYSLAKYVGYRMCEMLHRQYGMDTVCMIPCNLYGPGDSFDQVHSHVVPSLIRRFHEAKLRGDAKVQVWGTGDAVKEFLYVDDLVRACMMLLERYEGSCAFNVGSGSEISIRELAYSIKDVVGLVADIVFDTTKPDGVKKHLLDSTLIHDFGWRSETSLKDGLEKTYQWYCEQEK